MRILSWLRCTGCVAFAILALLVGQFAAAAPSDIVNAPPPAPSSDPANARDLAVGDYSVSPQTGAFTYSYPIAVPPGRRGMAPSLALTYSSQSSVRGGVAAGWSMPIPTIEIDSYDGVLAEQIPFADPRFKSSMAGQQRLIRVDEPSESAETYRAQHDATFTRYKHLVDDTWQVRTPDGMLHLFGESTHMQGSSNGRYAPITRSIDPHGNAVEYFWDKVADEWVLDHIDYTTNDGAGLNAHATVEFVYSTPPNCGLSNAMASGSQLSYRDGARRLFGSRRLDQIKTRVRDTQTGPFRTVREIDLSYDAAAQQCDQPHGPTRLLTAVQETAYDPSLAATTLPAVTFEYGSPARSFDNPYPMSFPNLDQPVGLGHGFRFDGDVRWPELEDRLMDIDGDGLLDRVFTKSNDCRLYWHRNDGNNFVFPYLIPANRDVAFSVPKLPWFNGQGPTGNESCSLTGQYTLAEYLEPPPPPCDQSVGTYNAYRFLDYDGDGLVDLFTAIHYDQGYFDPVQATGYTPNCGGVPWSQPPCLIMDPDCLDCSNPQTGCDPDLYMDCIGTADPTSCADIMEMGGSGGPVCGAAREPWEACDGFVFRIYKNLGVPDPTTGEIFDPNPITVISPIPLEADTGDSPSGNPSTSLAGTVHAFTDLDGDGYLDAVTLGPSDGPDTKLWQVFRGDGTGWFQPLPVTGSDPVPFGWEAPSGLLIGEHANGSNNYVRGGLFDVNGDGLPDYLDGDAGALKIYFNRANGFDRDNVGTLVDDIDHYNKSVIGGVDPPYNATRTDEISMIDFDADGLADQMVLVPDQVRYAAGDRLADPLAMSPYAELDRELVVVDDEWTLDEDTIDIDGDGRVDLVHFEPSDTTARVTGGPTNYEPARMLVHIDNGQGGTTDVRYAPSSDSLVVVPDGKKLPRAVWVTERVAVNPGLGAGDSTTLYKYFGPIWDKGFYLKYGFRGFDRTEGTGPRGGKTVTTFDYETDPSGREVEVVVYDDAGNPQTISSTQWDDFTLFDADAHPDDLVTYHPTEQRSHVCGVDGGGAPRTYSDCLANEPFARTLSTWTVVGSSGFLAPTETLLEERVGTSPPAGPLTDDRRTQVVDFEVQDTASFYFIQPRETDQHAWDGSSWSLRGRAELVYDSNGNVTDEIVTTDGIGTTATTKREYYTTTTGLLKKVIKPEQVADMSMAGTTYSYDLVHQLFPTSEANPKHVLYFEHDLGTGTRTRVEGPNFKVCGVGCIEYQEMQLTVDGLGRTTEVWTTDDSGSGYYLERVETRAYTDYDAGTSTPASVEIVRKGPSWQEQNIAYDGFGNVIEHEVLIDRYSVPQVAAVSTYTYEHGSLKTISVPNPETDTGDVTYTYSYDSLGRMESALDPYANGASMIHKGRTTERSAVTTDGTGGTSATTVDVFGRTVSVLEDVGGVDALTTYEYGPNDQLKRVIDASGLITELEHDHAGRRVAIVRNPGADERRWEYHYDLNGNLVEEIVPYPSGAAEADYKTVMQYDVLDRLDYKIPANRDLTPAERNELFAGTSYPIDYHYDDYASQSFGRLYQVDLPFGQVNFDYDARGNVTEETRSINFVHPVTATPFVDAKSITYTHNDDDSVAYVIYPDGTASFTAYDQRGFPATSYTYANSTWKKAAIATRNTAGLITYRGTDYNQYRDIGYDKRGRPISDSVHYYFCFFGCSWNVGGYWNASYYDDGNVDTMAIQAGTFDYTYDARGQLTDAAGPYSYSGHFTHLPNGQLDTVDVTWAPSGNAPPAYPRTNATYAYNDPSIPNPSAVYRINDAGGIVVQYGRDEVGNMTSRWFPGSVAETYRYDGMDRLRKATVNYQAERYYYDHAESRMLRLGTDNGVWLTFAGMEFYYNSTGTEDTSKSQATVTFAGRPVAQIRGGASVMVRYHNDRQNLLLSMQTNNWQDFKAEYGPFGEVLFMGGFGTGQDGNLRRFNDKEHDLHTGLNYYGYRFYDPFALVWNRADPAYRFAPELAHGEPLRLGLYTFSLNNPMRYVDPDGRDPLDRANTPAQWKREWRIFKRRYRFPQHNDEAQATNKLLAILDSFDLPTANVKGYRVDADIRGLPGQEYDGQWNWFTKTILMSPDAFYAKSPLGTYGPGGMFTVRAIGIVVHEVTHSNQGLWDWLGGFALLESEIEAEKAARNAILMLNLMGVVTDEQWEAYEKEVNHNIKEYRRRQAGIVQWHQDPNGFVRQMNRRAITPYYEGPWGPVANPDFISNLAQ